MEITSIVKQKAENYVFDVSRRVVDIEKIIEFAKQVFSAYNTTYVENVYIIENGKLVIVPEEAEVVRYVIGAKDAGETSQHICDTLNAQGKTNRSGTKFSISTLQVIIDNKPLYEGRYRYGKDSEWIHGEHEPILGGGDIE